MAKKKNSEKPALTNAMFEGGTVEQERLSSGVPLKFEDQDQEAILRFLGETDISEMVGKEDGEAVLLKFTDGKRTVQMGKLFALSKINFRLNHYYYMIVKGLVETKYNPMKDIETTRLGEMGETLKCNARINKSGSITLTDENIAEANYNGVLYYPLNPDKNFNEGA